MNLTDASHLARRLMNEHGLGRVPFEFDRGRKRIGACHYIRINGVLIVSKITLSHHYTAALPESEIKEVILHEIAHAKVGAVGHGPEWRAMARSLGIEGNRCHVPSVAHNESVGAWQARCSHCGAGTTKGYHRAPLRLRSCGSCSPKFDSTKLLDWYHHGKKVSLESMPQRYQNEYRVIFGKVLTGTR